MNKIYIIVGECREKFVEICKRFTNDKNEIDEAVQEVILGFLKMNPATLKKIYEKDFAKIENKHLSLHKVCRNRDIM